MRRRVTMGCPAGFWIVAYLFAAVMVGTTLPTPLYVIYQAQWHFSSGITTIIFASYAVGVLVALLLAGRCSDQVGRRPGRGEFIAAGVAGFVAFSLLGMFTALAPAFLGEVLHEHSHAVGGAVVFAVFGTAAATQLLLARFPSRTVITCGLTVIPGRAGAGPPVFTTALDPTCRPNNILGPKLSLARPPGRQLGAQAAHRARPGRRTNERANNLPPP